MATICALAVVLAGVAAYGWHVGWFAKSTSNGNTTTPQTSQTSALPRADVPSPKKNEPAAQAQRAVSAMTLEERVGQLVMVPLLAGSDLVPRPDEEEHQHDAQCRFGNREDDLTEDGPTACAVDGRRFQDRLRKRSVDGGKQVRAERALDHGEDDDDRPRRVV